jgi:autotransporter-associated beta strand protein
MTRSIRGICVAALVIGCVQASRAEGPADATAVVDKAIKAIGGQEKLARVKAMTWKTKGTLSFGGSDNEFTGETTVQGHDHVRALFRADFGGQPFEAVTVLAGDKGWRKFGDQSMEMDSDSIANEKRTLYLQWIPTLLLPLKEKEFKIETAGEAQVSGKPAVGLKVTGPDKKDFVLYFDKESGLPVKQVAKVIGFMGEEFTQETSYDGYKEMDGIKKATKIENKRDGEKFVAYEVSDFKALEKVDPSTFKAPE